MSDTKLLEWRLKNHRTKVGHEEDHYTTAVSTYPDGSEREFHAGECVWMRSDSEEVWAGIIVDFWNDPDDDDPMRVILRWFYNYSHIDPDTKVERGVGKYRKNVELYFSDDLDMGDNPVGVIGGKVYVFQTMEEFEKNCENFPTDSWEGDVICLVRNFYRPKPPQLRPLEKGELIYLMRNPSTTKMWNRYSTAYNSRDRWMNGKREKLDLPLDKRNQRKYGDSKRELERFLIDAEDEYDEEEPLEPREKRKKSILDDIYGPSYRYY